MYFISSTKAVLPPLKVQVCSKRILHVTLPLQLGISFWAVVSLCLYRADPFCGYLYSKGPTTWGFMLGPLILGDSHIGVPILVPIGMDGSLGSGAASLNGADTPEKKLVIALCFGLGVLAPRLPKEQPESHYCSMLFPLALLV